MCQSIKEQWLPFLHLLAAALGVYHIYQRLTEKSQLKEEAFPFLCFCRCCISCSLNTSALTEHVHTLQCHNGNSELSWPRSKHGASQKGAKASSHPFGAVPEQTPVRLEFD